jgi:hypothetical protein
MPIDGLVVDMVPVLAEGVAGLPTEAVIVLGLLAVMLAIIAIRIAIKLAIRIGIVALVVLGGLWALAEFADIHLLFF